MSRVKLLALFIIVLPYILKTIHITAFAAHLLLKEDLLAHLLITYFAKKTADLTFNKAKPTASLALGYEYIFNTIDAPR